MNNGVYALPGFMAPAAKNWKSQLLTNEDGSVKLCVYVGKPGTKVYYSLGIPGWKWGFIKDAQYFIDKRYPEEVIKEVSKFADYLDEEVIELPEGAVVPDIIINGWPIPITESPIEDKVYWILNIPKFVLPVGDTEVQISANGKLIKYTITRPDFSIHYNINPGYAASCEPEGDYVTMDAGGAITGGRLDTLEDGSSLQSGRTTLTSWNIDLPALTDGSNMFSGCSSLTSFTGDLPSLTTGSYMFQNCKALTSFEGGDLSALTNGNSMFFYCTSLTSFTGDLSALTKGNNMFQGCESLESFKGDLSAITQGGSMFRSSAITSFSCNLPALTSCTYMFYECRSLESFKGDLSAITTGTSMFHNCVALKSFESDLSVLRNASNMFAGTGLTSWNIPLRALAGGMSMFAYSELTTFLSDLPTLISGNGMFNRCESLESFDGGEGGLSAMTDGDSMFRDCIALKSFKGDLSSLTDGSYMFDKCQLNKESALRVLNTIPTYTSGSRMLHIGIHVDCRTDEEVLEAIDAAEAKGWWILMQWNGTASTSGVSTYGLRHPIYAKLGEPMEDGTPMLDWGHYVTDWEKNGYQEFTSLEEAREYFNISEEEQS